MYFNKKMLTKLTWRILSKLKVYYLSCIHVSTAIVLMKVKEQTNRYCKMKPTNEIKTLKISQLRLNTKLRYYLYLIAREKKTYP